MISPPNDQPFSLPDDKNIKANTEELNKFTINSFTDNVNTFFANKNINADFTETELWWFVHLLLKRAKMQVDGRVKAQDALTAEYYFKELKLRGNLAPMQIKAFEQSIEKQLGEAGMLGM